MKRWIAMLLTLVMALGLLTACGAAPAETPAPATDATEPPVDLAAQVLLVASKSLSCSMRAPGCNMWALDP